MVDPSHHIMGVSINGGSPIAGSKWMVYYSWKVHLYMDDSCGYPHDYGNLHDLKMVDFPSINDHHFWSGEEVAIVPTCIGSWPSHKQLTG